ncbi:MAG: DUF885 family protein [Gemmatimonadaceae bacterium]|nr:DUF885 family protein [Gemmatimonadaceae bacterium]
MDLDSSRDWSVLLSAALAAFFAHYYRRHPVTATFTGVHDYDHPLPDWSRAARSAEAVEMRELRARLEQEHPLPSQGAGALSDDPTGLDAELARANLDVRLAEFASGHFVDRNPALWTGEAIFGAVSLMIRPFASADARLAPLTSRLAAIPAFLREMQTSMNGAVPALWRDRARRECQAAQELFDTGLNMWLAQHSPSGDRHAADAHELPTADVAALQEAAASARAAFADADAWLAGLPVADANVYASGESLMQSLLSRGHYCDFPPRVLLEEAERAMVGAVARLEEALVPYDGSWPAAHAALALDAPSVHEYYPSFEAKWRAIRDAVVAREVVTWPTWPIRYVPIPAWAQVAAPQLYWLFYRSPAPFDRYGVYDYVVTPIDDTMPADVQAARLAAWNHSTITLNHVVHHGGIGHHVQNWHAIHRSSSQIGKIAAVDAASRIGMFLGGSMAEGWACYATGLVGELGLLSPLEQISERHTQVRLLARAIVDLRLHLGDWSFDACVHYYESRVGMTAAVALAETTKNSMFPATALMYWLGTQGIVDLRAHHQEALGDKFSLKQFHDDLLRRGAIPVLLVAQLMEGSA